VSGTSRSGIDLGVATIGATDVLLDDLALQGCIDSPAHRIGLASKVREHVAQRPVSQQRRLADVGISQIGDRRDELRVCLATSVDFDRRHAHSRNLRWISLAPRGLFDHVAQSRGDVEVLEQPVFVVLDAVVRTVGQEIGELPTH